MAQLGASDAERAARPCGRRPVLDLHVHQLAAHAGVLPSLGTEVPGSWADHNRRPHARVQVRARSRQRALGGRGEKDRLSGRDRQRRRRLACVRQQLLARPLFVDAQGQIRHHRFGEGDYERSEMVIRQLLADAGVEDQRPGLASVEPNGDEVQADWENLGSPESYLGYDQATGFDPGGRAVWDKPHTYTAPESLRLNRWGLMGDWTVRSDASALNGTNGRAAYQLHARDVNLVMGPARKGSS